MSHECASILWLIGATAATATTKASRENLICTIHFRLTRMTSYGKRGSRSTNLYNDVQFFARSAWSNQLTSRHYINLLNEFRMPFLFSLISSKSNVELYFLCLTKLQILLVSSHLNTWSDSSKACRSHAWEHSLFHVLKPWLKVRQNNVAQAL